MVPSFRKLTMWGNGEERNSKQVAIKLLQVIIKTMKEINPMLF